MARPRLITAAKFHEAERALDQLSNCEDYTEHLDAETRKGIKAIRSKLVREAKACERRAAKAAKAKPVT